MMFFSVISIKQVILKVYTEVLVGLHVKCIFFLVALFLKLQWTDKFWWNLLISNLLKICSAMLRLLHVYGTDGQMVSAQGCRCVYTGELR
jgi:hypothetical protein